MAFMTESKLLEPHLVAAYGDGPRRIVLMDGIVGTEPKCNHLPTCRAMRKEAIII
jgi:hypothetical protein